MYHLGVPTTRGKFLLKEKSLINFKFGTLKSKLYLAGSCVTSDTRVVRDIFYDGNPIMERCTIVSRIAPSFIR